MPEQRLKKNCFMPVCQSWCSNCGILTVLTSQSARVSDFSPYVILFIYLLTNSQWWQAKAWRVHWQRED